MGDLIYVGGTLVFFLVSAAYIAGCRWLQR